MKRGEIRWYKFKNPDKKLTRDSVLEYLEEVTVAPITSKIRDIPSEVLLTREDSLRKDCAINCDHLQTVSKSKTGSLITTLSEGKLSQVSKAIWFALNL